MVALINTSVQIVYHKTKYNVVTMNIRNAGRSDNMTSTKDDYGTGLNLNQSR